MPSEKHPFAPQPVYTAIIEARKAAEAKQDNVREAVRMGLKMRREHEQKLADNKAVDHFARIMKEKLAKKREEGRSGWQDMTAAELSKLLHDHVAKGDPVDVANIAMMLHLNGQSIETSTAAEQAEPAPAARSGAVKVKALEWENGEADTIIGTYKVKKDSSSDWRAFREGWTLYSSPTVPAIFGSEDEAKAAAQADYEQRILAALEPAEPAAICVACEGKPSPENNPCAVCGKKAEPAADAEPLELQPQEPNEKLKAMWADYEAVNQQKRPPESRLREAAERVVWFDWSGNDDDAVKAIDELRAALAQGADDECP